MLYWSDVMSEVAFIVPSPQTYQPKSRRNSLDNQQNGEYFFTTILNVFVGRFLLLYMVGF